MDHHAHRTASHVRWLCLQCIAAIMSFGEHVRKELERKFGATEPRTGNQTMYRPFSAEFSRALGLALVHNLYQLSY